MPLKEEEIIQLSDAVFEQISSEIKTSHNAFIQRDFQVFKSKGIYLIQNAFAGGIIFLREPETIEEIKVVFNSSTNSALAKVKYGSEVRNTRNVKYKPNAGKSESVNWNMLQIFPHFHEYDNDIRVDLITLIGKIIKTICEDLNQKSWFMQYKENFDLELFLDKEKVITIPIKSIYELSLN